MKIIFSVLILSTLLQACTCVQMTPEEREEARERRAAFRAERLMSRGER